MIKREDSVRDTGYADLVPATEFVQLSNFLSAIPFVFNLHVCSNQYGSGKLYSELNSFPRGGEPPVI